MKMKLIQISIRVEPDILKEVDRIVRRDRPEMIALGSECTRNSIVRKALRKFVEKQ